ncbi:MAG: hypothetical protein L3K24_11365 [Gammaproteobacteria bacterium]|nr:hypothetical protein [Gammaproteobacteria bacterium]
MLDSVCSCFRMISSIHRGLYDAWIFGFFINDDPSTLVKPEYLATVKVGESIASRFIKDSGLTGLILNMEERANDVASHCFCVPPLPFKKRKVPSRSGRNGRERIDITIFDVKKSILKVSRSVVELKLVSSSYHLKADLKRNKVLMELSDTRGPNHLKIACLGFIVVDDKSINTNDAQNKRITLRKKYQDFAKQYVSSAYKIHVSIRELSSPSNDEDRIGEFIHMASVVISFIRIKNIE